MAKQRYISSDFWVDPFIQEISTTEKLLYIYLFTNSHVDLCGIYEVSERTIAFESGIDKKSVSKALEGFRKKGKVFYHEGWIQLVNFGKHLKVNPNITKGIERSLQAVPERVTKAFRSLSKHSTPIPNGITYRDNLVEQPILIPNEEKEKIGFELFREISGKDPNTILNHIAEKMFPGKIPLSENEMSECTDLLRTFLEYWTAPMQKGRNVGKMKGETVDTFSWKARINTFIGNKKPTRGNIPRGTDLKRNI